MNTTTANQPVAQAQSAAAVQAQEHQGHSLSRSDFVRIAFVGMAIIASWLRWFEPFPNFSIVGFVATLIGGYPIFEEAVTNLWSRRMTMELSMTIALVAALAIGEVFTAEVIVFFVLIAEALEKYTVGRGRRAIGDLLSLLPQNVFIRRQGNIDEVETSTITPGVVVVVKPGSAISVDGIVLSGNSFVDQSAITGESMPVEKLPGSFVYAGTINQSGVLDIETASVGQDTAFGKIIHAVEEAEHSQAPVQKIADQLAGYLVYFAMAGAVLTYLITHDIKSTISVIIVAGACGIAAGTPLAIVGAIGRAARSGAIIKGGRYLEQLGVIDTVVFDKTGTLTFGAPEVCKISAIGAGVSQEKVLELAGIAECSSEHPLGKAIMNALAGKKLKVSRPDKFAYIPGKGIICELAGEEIVVGNRLLMIQQNISLLDCLGDAPDAVSEVLVAKAGLIMGSIHLADEIRPEAPAAVEELKHLGIKTVLLTGDSDSVAAQVANVLGVHEVVAGMLPDQKLSYINSLMSQGRRVAMVGDGINDAPALMVANVGVAIGSGTDVARECADVVLIGSDLGRFVQTIVVARRCRGIIMANFAGTIIVDSVGILLAACGFLNPLVAALIHVTSELAFIMNSARLLPGRSN